MRISVDQVRIGMFVERLDRPWLGTPFPFQGFRISTLKEIEQLRELCHHVYVYTSFDPGEETASDPARSEAARGRSIRSEPVPGDMVPRVAKAVQPPPSRPQRRPLGKVSRRHYPDPVNKHWQSFAGAVSRAKELHYEVKTLVEGLRDDIRQRRPFDAERAITTVREVVASVIGNPEALLWLTQLRKEQEYTAIHSVNVCILSLVFGRQLNFDEATLNVLGLGALLHDIGKLRVPEEILNKPDRLTPAEFEVMKRHPGYGVDFLRTARTIPVGAINIVHSHHERFAGGGYPLGFALNREEDVLVQVVSIVDFYDALTSDRIYRKGVPSLETLRMMHQVAGQMFNPDLVRSFIQYLGMHPSGSVVELNTGEIGIVLLGGGRRSRPHPVVMLILDPDHKKYHPLRIVNFQLFADRKNPYEIKRQLPNGAHGIDVRDYVFEMAGGREQSPPAGS